MIDVRTEPLIPLKDARRNPLLQMSNGRPPAFCTVLKYVQSGVRGGIKLEAVVKPSGLYTSELAIERFIEALTAAQFPQVRQPTPLARDRAKRRAAEMLDAAGM